METRASVAVLRPLRSAPDAGLHSSLSGTGGVYIHALHMEGQHSGSRAIPPRLIVIAAASAVVIGIASVVYLWPTLSWLHPPKVHGIPRPATYASYDVVAESESDLYLLERPSGGGSASATLDRTQDAGATWHRIALPALPSGVAVVVTSLPGGKLFLRTFGFSTGAQQFYVGDGTTWAQIALPDQGTGWLQMIDARLGFYVVTQAVGSSLQELLIYRTLDGGRIWEQRLALTADHPNGGGLHLSDDSRFLAFSDSMHGWQVVVPAHWAIVCGATSSTDAVEQLMASQDGGANWAAISLPALPQGSTDLGPPFFPGGGASGYLTATAHTFVRECPPAGITYVYGTIDDGATWSGPRALPGPYFDTRDGVVWWASDGRKVFRSSNQGQNWQTTVPKLPSAAVTLVELFAVNANSAWSLWSSGSDQAPGRQTLLRTTDAGAHWSEVKLPGS